MSAQANSAVSSSHPPSPYLPTDAMKDAPLPSQSIPTLQHEGNPLCWIDDFTYTTCCDQFGTGSMRWSCWDGLHTADSCCGYAWCAAHLGRPPGSCELPRHSFWVRALVGRSKRLLGAGIPHCSALMDAAWICIHGQTGDNAMIEFVLGACALPSCMNHSVILGRDMAFLKVFSSLTEHSIRHKVFLNTLDVQIVPHIAPSILNLTPCVIL